MNALQNIDAEQALLGALLYRNEILAVACDGLLPEHFSEAVHARIFEASSTLIRAGKLASPVTLKTYFERDETLKEIGGTAYLARLAGAAATIVNAREYAVLIRDLALRRELIARAEMVIGEVPNLPVDQSAGEYASNLAAELSRLAEGGERRRTTRTGGEILAEVVEQAAAAFQNEGKSSDRIPTGIATLDEKIGGFGHGDLNILAARTSMGKTAVGTKIAYNVARSGIPVLFVSLEMTAVEIGFRLAAIGSGIPFDRIERGAFTEAEFDRICGIGDTVNTMPIVIDDRDSASAADIGALIARTVAKRPSLGLVVIDYLGLLAMSSRYAGRKVDEIGEMTVALKGMAKRYNVAILLLAQLNRAVESRENKRPMLADLRDSGSIEQDADTVLFVYRAEYYLQRALDAAEPGSSIELDLRDQLRSQAGIMEIIIAKKRQGQIGTVRLRCDMATGRIEDMPRAHAMERA